MEPYFPVNLFRCGFTSLFSGWKDRSPVFSFRRPLTFSYRVFLMLLFFDLTGMSVYCINRYDLYGSLEFFFFFFGCCLFTQTVRTCYIPVIVIVFIVVMKIFDLYLLNFGFLRF